MGRLASEHLAEFEAVRDLCYRGFDSAELRERVGDRLMRHLGGSSYCFGATDPSTALPVHSVSVGLDPSAMEVFYALVLATPSLDFGPWVAGGRRVARLEDLVDDVERDPYMTEILRPSGLRHDIQMSCSAGGWSWGHLCLRRRAGDPSFAAHEVRFLEALTPHITTGLRVSATRTAQAAVSASTTGVVVIAPDGRVELANGVAERLFRQPVSGDRHSFLTGVNIMTTRLEATLGRGETPALEPLLLVDEATQTTYRLRAERAMGADGRTRGLVLIEPASSAEPADQLKLLSQFGLSRRECEVAVAAVRGRTTSEIAADLVVSPHTVADHLRKVYDKVGVSSRQQLALRLLGG